MSNSIKLKVYNKTTDISSAELALKKLDTEIKESGFVSGFSSLALEGDSIIVYGESILYEASLDALVSNHNADEDIEELREELVSEVDEAANQKRGKFLTQHMDLTYVNKKLEAQKFLDAGSPEADIDDASPFSGAYPYVSSYKEAEELATGHEAASNILGIATSLGPLDAEIENHRNKRKRQIKGSSSRSEMKNLRSLAINAINGIGA